MVTSGESWIDSPKPLTVSFAVKSGEPFGKPATEGNAIAQSAGFAFVTSNFHMLPCKSPA